MVLKTIGKLLRETTSKRTLALLKRAVTRPVMPEPTTHHPTPHPWRDSEAPQDPRRFPQVPEHTHGSRGSSRASRHQPKTLSTPASRSPESLRAPRPLSLFCVVVKWLFCELGFDCEIQTVLV